MKIFIDEDGNTSGLKSPLTEALGLKERKRVSHIEPVNQVLRWLFHCIRKVVADDSWLAGFTRCWPVKWRANIFDGPILGPFRVRQAAVEAEVAYINELFEGLISNDRETLTS